ncbi:hypothetical protein H257_10138 [Aphanomyces astaci]|uniref:Glycoside hydrolase family 5 domain-containing protein n=2 Tax=Aphanomyces astaci TaxID=112090 RepID=W4G7T1_APHAT|nr:hypothetical protein H257_10138 [Aphanomyces astaci]ETV75767.1 hypothetical protein H257_10138 [Aphanomyces astaci]|eukprot:XP_009834898.1 hypothetical protein H257_10138 [Aphanomyces astaci]
MSRPQYYTQDTHDSVAAHDDPMENVEVWQDTTAERGYNTYLVQQSSVMDSSHSNESNLQSGGARPTFGDRQTMADRGTIAAARPDIRIGKVEDGDRPTKTSGRKRVWPGWLLLFLMVAGSLFGITWFSIKLYKAAQKQQEKAEFILNRTPRPITPAKICEQPDFINDKGVIYATYKSAPPQKIVITGINWSGMENSEGVPHGLAFGQAALDDIVERMAKQGMTAVRLPLNVLMINSNAAPNVKDFVDPVVNPELVVSDYMTMIKKIVQGLAKKGVSVLLDIHKLDPAVEGKTEGLWYSATVPASAINQAIQTLATDLCNSNYYNVLGVDLKNEPHDGCWPGGAADVSCPDAKNWPKAAAKLADTMLAACPKWMAFVEGLASATLTNHGFVTKAGPNTTLYYQEWWGAALQNVTKYPVPVAPAHKNKLVYVPHFYSPSVYPAPYYFASFASAGGGAVVEEWPTTADGNASLKANVYRALDLAFGNAVKNIESPVMFGEFGGIYGAKDLFPLKTSSRVIELFVQYSADRNMSGGFAWSLNPDSVYQFNGDTSKAGEFNYGLYENDPVRPWSAYNQDYSDALLKFKGTGTIDCVKIDAAGNDTTTTTTTTAGPAVVVPTSTTAPVSTAVLTTKKP